MSKFWSAWSSLASRRTTRPLQQAVVDAGQTLASTFNAVAQQMQTVQSQASQQYASLTGANGQVPQDAQQIATLNAQITQATQAGISPNTLLDQRDKAARRPLQPRPDLGEHRVQRRGHGQLRRRLQPAGERDHRHLAPDADLGAGGQLGSLLNMSLLHRPGRRSALLAGQRRRPGHHLGQRAAALQPLLHRHHRRHDRRVGDRSTVQTSSSSTSGADLATPSATSPTAPPISPTPAFVAQVGIRRRGCPELPEHPAGGAHRRLQPAPERLGRLAG